MKKYDEYETFDEILNDHLIKSDPRLAGLIDISEYSKVVCKFAYLYAKKANKPTPDVEQCLHDARETLYNQQWFKGSWRSVNNQTVPNVAQSPISPMIAEFQEKTLVAWLAESYQYAKPRYENHPDPVKFAETCRKLFPVAKDVAKFAESIRRHIANCHAQNNCKDAVYSNTMLWAYSLRSGRVGKSKFLETLNRVFQKRLGATFSENTFSDKWIDPFEYKADIKVWNDTGDLYDKAKETLNNFIDHAGMTFNIKGGKTGNFFPRGAYAASSNYLPPGIMSNGDRYRMAEWFTLGYTTRPAEMKKYWPKNEEYEDLVWDLIDSCPLNPYASADIESDTFREGEFLAYEKQTSLFPESATASKYVLKPFLQDIACDIRAIVDNGTCEYDKCIRVGALWSNYAGYDKAKKVSSTYALLNDLADGGVIRRTKTPFTVKPLNFKRIIDLIDFSFVTDETVVDEVYVRKQWDLFVSYARQKFGPKNGTPTPPTPPVPPKKDEIVVNEAPVEAPVEVPVAESFEDVNAMFKAIEGDPANEADPLDLVAEEDVVLNEAPEVAVEAVPQAVEDAFDEASEQDENPDDYFDQGLMSALCEQHSLMPCASVTSAPTPKDVYNADTWVKSPRQEFVVAAECVNVEKRGSFEVYDRKRANCRPSAFVFESDSLSVEEQAGNLKPEMKKHTLWGTFSGKKSIHVLVPIPAALRDDVNDPAVYKAVWKAVGSRLFANPASLDEACASIGRLTRMPWAKRDGNGKVQKMLWVNADPAPLAWLPEVVAFAKSERDGQKMIDASRRAVAKSNAVRNAQRFGNAEHTRETELKHLEACQAKHPTEVKALAIDSIRSGVVPAGSNMVGALCALKWVNDAGEMPFEILSREFYDLARTQHPTNIGQPYEYYGFKG